ncbi:MAG TPA: STAS/SEC14 domain-containing protein [Solirubrobacterales bacterium]
MIERIDAMPSGTIGLRSSGKLSREDYTQVLEPALNGAIESGEIRLLFLLSDFDGLEPGAWIEDAKTGLSAWAKHHSAWKRFALVTDVEWVAKAMRTFTWLAPGEVRVFPPAELDAAKSWVAG